MVPLGGDLRAPTCDKPGQGEVQLGWSVKFNVQKRLVKISGGKTDVDYVRWVLKPKHGNSYMELWFGSYALSTEPDDDLLVNSVEFEQRGVSVEGFGVIGMDSRGRLPNGHLWRQTAIIASGGSIYQDASPEDAMIFDQIANSICNVPRPKE
jgi:hypothetical protein